MTTNRTVPCKFPSEESVDSRLKIKMKFGDTQGCLCYAILILSPSQNLWMYRLIELLLMSKIVKSAQLLCLWLTSMLLFLISGASGELSICRSCDFAHFPHLEGSAKWLPAHKEHPHWVRTRGSHPRGTHRKNYSIHKQGDCLHQFSALNNTLRRKFLDVFWNTEMSGSS